MKSVKQIADTLGIDKQRVYRYIKKNHISEVHRSASTLYYDEAVETLINQYFSISTVSDGVHQSTSNDTTRDVVNMLKNELLTKNKLIEEQQQTIKELAETIKIQAQSINAAHQNELVETVIDGQKALSAPVSTKINWWIRLFQRKN